MKTTNESPTGASIMTIAKVITCIAGVFLVNTAWASTEDMTYDSLGRLTSVTYQGGYQVTYSYDPAGNILSKVVTANPLLSVARAGAGTGTVVSAPEGIACGGTCTANFAYSASVTLTATPTGGSTFAGWGGDCTGTGTCSVTMDAPRNVVATFAPEPVTHLLSAQVSGTGSGTIQSDPAGIACGATCSASFNEGTVVTLTATAAAGSTFAGWGGACTGVGGCSVSMSMARTVTAQFDRLPTARGDVNGDGRSDLMWRTTSPGSGLSWWTMNGAAVSGANYFEVGAEWQIADVGDLNGDGKVDIIWRRSTDGATYLWTLDGLAPVGFFDLGILDPAVWALVGTADLNGDGRADLMWRNLNDGTVYVWLMNGGSIIQQGVTTVVGNEWVIVDLADFNGDRRADILWRRTTDGSTAFWTMDGITSTGGGSITTVDPSQWILVGSADFDGNGKADLLWRSTTGDTVVWLMNDGAFVSAGYLGNPGPGWSVRALADLDGDGKYDLVWRHTDGTAYWWKMNGASAVAFQPIANPGGNWQIVAP